MVSLVTSPVCLHDSEVPDGFKEDGSVVTWGGVLKSLMDLLGEGSTAAIPKSLMDSLDDRFVVTWRMALESDECGLSFLLVTGKCASGLRFLSPFFVRGVIHSAELGWFYASAGNDPETAHERHPDYDRLHSKVFR